MLSHSEGTYSYSTILEEFLVEIAFLPEWQCINTVLNKMLSVEKYKRVYEKEDD